MKKKSAPKSMARHEEEAMRGGRGKKVRRFDIGGTGYSSKYMADPANRARLQAEYGHDTARFRQMGMSEKQIDAMQKQHNELVRQRADRYADKMAAERAATAKAAQRKAAQMAALKTVGRVAARAVPVLGAGLMAYDVGKFAYDQYKNRQKPKTSVEAEPENVSAEAAKSGVKAVSGASRGGGGGAPPMAPRGMGPIMPMMPERRGKVTVEELPEKGQGKYRGGKIQSHKASKGPFRHAADGVAHKGKTKGRVVKMREGGMAYSSGGSVFRKSADGIASKGKTKGHMVKMRYGGEC